MHEGCFRRDMLQTGTRGARLWHQEQPQAFPAAARQPLRLSTHAETKQERQPEDFQDTPGHSLTALWLLLYLVKKGQGRQRMLALRAEHAHRDLSMAWTAGLGKTSATFFSLRKCSSPDAGAMEKITLTLSGLGQKARGSGKVERCRGV